MSGWLSSKLKEAEQFLHQIDQQAAESLGKPEKQKNSILPQEIENKLSTKQVSDFKRANQKGIRKEILPGGKLDVGSKTPNSTLSELARKPANGSNNNNAKLETLQLKKIKEHQIGVSEKKLHRDDWTELLSSPNIESLSSPALASSVGSTDSGRVGFTRGTTSKFASSTSKNGVGYLSSKSPHASENIRIPSVASKFKPSTSSAITDKSRRFRDETLRRRLENDLDGHVWDANLESAKLESPMDEVGADGRGTPIQNSVGGTPLMVTEPNTNVRGDIEIGSRNDRIETSTSGQDMDQHVKASTQLLGRTDSITSEGVCKTVPDILMDKESIFGPPTSDIGSKNTPAEVSEHSDEFTVQDQQLATEVVNSTLLENRTRSFSFETEDDGYDSESITDSESDRDTDSEEEEIERRKSAHQRRIAQRKKLAAIRAAAAQNAIRERIAFVQKLESEVATLQNILGEREEQKDREAAKLRLSITELLQALEAEKKSHNSTRMEAMARESHLENENADLAKSLGSLQWELEEQMSQLLKTRSIVEAKEAKKAELERRLEKLQTERSHAHKIKDVTNPNVEDCTFEEEQSELWKGIQQCQIQVKDLEVKIHSLRDTMHVPTQIEVEFDTHLAQLTDQLIHKQAQVEALSTEKSTLLIRLEAVSKAIEEEKQISQTSRSKGNRKNFNWDVHYDDMEYGHSNYYDPKTKSYLYDPGESSAMLSSTTTTSTSPLLRQLNAVFSAGLFFLRKHRWAQVLAIVYIVSLHLWVLFVLSMNSKPSQEPGLLNSITELKSASNVSNLP